MPYQTNPYLIWQLIPSVITLGIGLYIQSRPVKKRESDVFSLLMFAGSLWAFANAVQLVTPNIGWQRFWNGITYLGIMAVPTAWFLLAVKITGFAREKIERVERWLWLVPGGLFLFLVTSSVHHLFFTNYRIVDFGGYSVLENEYGPLFFFHTMYSYILLISGVVILTLSLVSRFKQYGAQAYGLIIGVVAPLIGNAYFLFGSTPEGFPDPTPIMFTITGLAFAWAIFGGHMLEVIPLAHETIVRKLSAGVLILDSERNIRDINQAAIKMLGLPANTYPGDSLLVLLKNTPAFVNTINKTLDDSLKQDQNIQTASPVTGRAFDVFVSHLGDQLGHTTGWLVQFNDISDKKQAEENLVATQSTLNAVLDTLQDNFFEADRDGIITNANKAFVQHLGFDRLEDVLGKSFSKFTEPSNVRGILEKFKLLYETKQPLESFEYVYRTKNGRIYIGETTISPMIDGDVVVGSRGLIRDVTARVNAEKEIRQQKELMDSLLQQSPIAMVINDKRNFITMVNPAFEKLFGFSRDEVIGKRLEDILPPPEKVDSGAVVTNTSIVKATASIRKRRTKLGTLVDVEIFNAPFHVGGERFGYLTFYNDITDRVKTKNELEKSQSTYFSVLETLQDAYFEALPSGYVVYVNQAFCNACGYTKEELLGSHFRMLTSAKSIRETLKNFNTMYETGKPIPSFDFIYRRKDGREFPSEMVVSPIIDEGNVVGARGIIRDISARVEVEAVLRQARDVAEARARELSAINRLAGTVGRSLDLDEVLQSVCNELVKIFEIRNAGIGLLTPDKTQLEIVAFQAADPNEKSALGLMLPVEGNTSSLEVIRTGKTVFIQDAQSDPRTDSIADISRQRGTRSIMIVPLLTRGETIGTIGMPAKDPNHVFTEGEIELAETIASQIAAAVENARLYAKTESALDVAERDLEIGRQIQSGFFPEHLPKLDGWEIATHFDAARQVAGDFYDVFQFKNSRLTAFIVADVCDKGVGAALFMVLFRSLLRAFSGNEIDTGNVDAQLLKTITNTNNYIAEYHDKSNMFATLFYGILDPESGVLTYVNGGHEPPVILNKDGNIVQRLSPTGPAVGMFPGMEFRVEHIQFNEGDFFVGFTDGTTDAQNGMGEQFTEPRLLKSISYPWTSIFSMLFELNSELQAHIGGQKQFDDITLISFRRNLTNEVVPHAICRPADLHVLEELRDFVESVGHHSGLKQEDVFAFKLAADELCANIIQYGFEGREPGALSLFFDVDNDRARLVIRDNGKYFSPDQAKNPDIDADWDEREIGGLGIYFVKELMDNVTYNRTENNVNQFILEKVINQPISKKE